MRPKWQVLLARYDSHQQIFWEGRADDLAEACRLAKDAADKGRGVHLVPFRHAPTPAFVVGVQNLGSDYNATWEHKTQYGEGIMDVPRQFTEAAVCGPVVQPWGEFGPNTMKRVRKEHGLSQSALAEFCGYGERSGVNTFCKYEGGQSEIPKLVKLAMAWIYLYGPNFPWENT